MASTWDENFLIPVPEEARRASRRTRPLDVIAAVGAGPQGGADSLKRGGPKPSWRPPERDPRAAPPERGSARAQRPAAPD